MKYILIKNINNNNQLTLIDSVGTVSVDSGGQFQFI